MVESLPHFSQTEHAQCLATLISAPGSGHGKTMLTAALAARLTREGQRVQVFKLGPDYLDPTILERASGQRVYNLDLWIMGEAHICQLLHQGASSNDIVLVEGLMGLFDHTPSNAEVAKRFGLPVTLVMDVAKLAQTSAAIAKGLIRYDEDVFIKSVVANRLGSQRHADLIQDSLNLVTHYAGGLRRDPRLSFEQRHLGLIQASDIDDIDQKLAAAADCLEQSDVDLALESVTFAPVSDAFASLPRLLDGQRIAIARDRAFGFIYPANLKTLQALGAQCEFFSPLNNDPIPECDAVWLPGGYPELHLDTLAANQRTQDAIKTHIAQGKPALAECGGMMYLGESISDSHASTSMLCGLLAARFQMRNRFQSIGPVGINTIDGELRGHAFHHSVMDTDVPALTHTRKASGQAGAGIFQIQQCIASYAHWYFASDPSAVARIFTGQTWLPE